MSVMLLQRIPVLEEVMWLAKRGLKRSFEVLLRLYATREWR